MNKYKVSFCLLLCLLAKYTIAQTTEFQGTIRLNAKDKIYKIVTIPNCAVTHTPPAGGTTTVTHETKFTNDKTEVTVESVLSPGAGALTIYANKTLRILISPDNEGLADLYLDEKDKTVLYVNYWLNAKHTLPAGTQIEEMYPNYSCTAGAVPPMLSRGIRVLAAEEDFYLWKVSPGSADMNTSWFKNSEHIKVFNAGGIDFYLVNRYDRNGKYVLDLQNRKSRTYNSKSLDFGALTVPFKYRFAFTKNTQEIKSDVTASFNVGVYGGYKLTRYNVINKAGTYSSRTFFSLRAGPFLNLSTTTLDSISTTVGKIPKTKDDKQTIAVMSTGLGLMADIKGVQLGLFGGWDFGVGAEATNWNYHKRFWLGFGLGYKLKDLFAKAE